MPIPTDTFWNIRRLNWVFAVSAVVLFAVTAWSIFQDYGHLWRQPQKQGRVWEAAMTTQKIDRDLTPDKKGQVERLQQQIAELEQKLVSGNNDYNQVEAQIKRLESDREPIEFEVNTLKSDVGVFEAQLQDAVTAGDAKRQEQLRRSMEKPAARLRDLSEKLAETDAQLAEAREKRKLMRADLDELIRERAKLSGDVELLQKKVDALQPKNVFAKLSAQIRAAPLMGFINPSEKPQHVILPHVLTDVSFMKITTVDRCMTCHVNIQKKDFTEANVLGYLQEQAAAARAYALPAVKGTKAADPAATADAPGPVAMVEFWQAWASKLAPDVIKKQAGRIQTVTNSVGKSATLTYDGQAVTSFKFDGNLLDEKLRAAAATQPAATTRPYLADAGAQNEMLVALLKAWYRYAPPDGAATASPVTVEVGKAKVTINAPDRKTADPIRTAAMRYAEEVRNGLAGAMDATAFNLLEDRYRYALVREVNAERDRQDLPKLDASAVFLAHPRLDLYASQDSAHPMDQEGPRIGMGCTSCHDGSGQETDFVLAAHVPRAIWVDEKSGEPVLPEQLLSPPQQHHAEDLSDMLGAVFGHDSVVPAMVSKLHFAAHDADHEAVDAHAAGPGPTSRARSITSIPSPARAARPSRR